MSRSVSVVIPVLEGARYLEQVLEAVQSQGEVELLVIDSGSQDGSRSIARSRGAAVVEIERSTFGHGRTRNLGAELTSGELICFLTQDAIPVQGWLAAYQEAFDLAPRVGAAFGPHLPHPETSPMIARDLEQWFAGFAPDGRPAMHVRGSTSFISNVNACYLRTCWDEIRFRDIAYSEDRAFGVDMLERGWTKVFHPAAAVRHAHDYSPTTFFRRYFDEYRGLRETIGHRQSMRPRRILRDVRGAVAADAAWMRERGWAFRARALWTARSAVHHSSRQIGAILGTRSERLPRAVERRLSLERRATRPDSHGHVRVAARPAHRLAEDIARVDRQGAAPLVDVVNGDLGRALHCAFVVPSFGKASGGHASIFHIIRELEHYGHTCSIWLYDPSGPRPSQPPSVHRRRIAQWYGPVAAPIFVGTSEWFGADVAIATGWDTVHATLLLTDCKAKTYLIQDHEPDFYPASAEAMWAATTYRFGLYGISASRWLHDLVSERYGQHGTWFQLGIARSTYHPHDVPRRRDTIVAYFREATPRRGAALALMGLAELKRERPGLRVVIFGQDKPPVAPFEYEFVGVLSPRSLAELYSEGTVGLCLSLTGCYSVVAQEMMACGLPCVDVIGGGTEAEFGSDAGVELAAPRATALAAAIDRLIVDEDLWRARSQAGIAYGASASWQVGGKQVEAGLREALRERVFQRTPDESTVSSQSSD